MRSVEIEFEDARSSDTRPNWRARINAAQLRDFCDRFTERLEDLVG